MKTVTTLLCLSTLAGMATAATELSVTVYEGPKECEEADKIKPQDYVKIHYTGSIDESSETGEKGFQFEDSREHGATFDFQIGNGAALKGWEEGMMGLCKGAKVILICPPDMGFGDDGAGGVIPGGATLKFDMDILDVSDKEPEMPNFFVMLDQNKDGKLTYEEMEVFFAQQGGMPEGMWEGQDKDQDGFVTWEEFSGPKGDSPPTVAQPEEHEEL